MFRWTYIYILWIAVVLATGLSAAAQTTKVKGRVTDAASGEGLPFVAVFFKGTTIGVSSDLDGYYFMETRDSTATMLCASLLGYEGQEIRISRGAFSEVDFRLQPASSAINAAVVKPDNRYIRWILSQINKNKKNNDPEQRQAYACDTYTKMELDLANADEQIQNKLIRKNFGFVFDYMDTSVISGTPYLPVMISETRARRFHSIPLNLNKEVIVASRISGLNEDNAISQFTGSMHLKTNFYDNFINAFNVQIPSPLSSSGETYYNYFLVDSLMIDGRKTWKIRFHPRKGVSSSVFDGEMAIDAEDFALRELHAKLRRGANINWIRDLVIDRTDQKLGDSVWFYLQDKLYVDFSVTMRDSSKMMSFLGNRQIDYMNPVLGKEARTLANTADNRISVAPDAGRKDEEWWESARPYRLSEKESDIYKMVDSIKTVPLYNNIYNIVNTVVTGYFETKYLGFGPYGKIYSFNSIEGNRVQFGIRTTPEISRRFRLTAFGAYGFKDRSFKGGGSLEWMIRRQPTMKPTLSGKRDILQLGAGTKAFNEASLLTSLLTRKGSGKRSMVNDYSLRYDWEIRPWLNTSSALEFRRIYANEFVPMLRVRENPSGGYDTTAVNSVGANDVRITARFSKDETVARGVFDKSYLHSDHPVVTLDLLGSLKGIGKNEYTYFRSEVTVDYKLPLPPIGTSSFKFTIGKLIGVVPYPMLKLHEGNGTYINDPKAFSCMEFYEFASDTWTTLFYEHNFGGFFLGKIPILKRLRWREIISLKAAYGTLSEKNNGILTSDRAPGAPLLFPSGMGSLNKPYVEMGCGISNIFNILRVDTIWRMTHRNIQDASGNIVRSPNRFVVNIGLELRF